MKKIFKKFSLFIISALTIFVGGYSYINYDSYDINAPYTQKVVTDFFEFKPMYTLDYNQAKFKTNCGPTAACNVISYFEKEEGEEFIKKINAKVPQDIYNNICKDMHYHPSWGTSMHNIHSYIEDYFEENTDYDCDITYKCHKKWDKLKDAIDHNKILTLHYKDHIYIIGGYEEDHGRRDIMVFTNWENTPYEYLHFNKYMDIYEVELK